MKELQDYACQLNAIRNTAKGNYSTTEHRTVLLAYEMLASHIFRTFKIPKNEGPYIMRSFEIQEIDTPSQMIGHLIRNNNNKGETFSLELPLRGLEVYFSFGEKQKIDPSDFGILDLLIFRLAYEMQHAK